MDKWLHRSDRYVPDNVKKIKFIYSYYLFNYRTIKYYDEILFKKSLNSTLIYNNY